MKSKVFKFVEVPFKPCTYPILKKFPETTSCKTFTILFTRKGVGVVIYSEQANFPLGMVDMFNEHVAVLSDEAVLLTND